MNSLPPIDRPNKQSSGQGISRLGYLLIYLGLAWICWALWPRVSEFGRYAQSVLNYAYVWALTENENMLFINGIVSGENFYSLTNGDAFYYFVYPPVFHLLSAGLIKLFDLTILIPRLISLSSFLAFIGLIFLFFKEKTKLLENLILSFLLASLTVSIGLYAKYYILARADMLAYALAFGSVLFAWRIAHLSQSKRNYYWWAGALALAALFTKQSVFFPYLLIAGLTFLAKDRQPWLKFTAYLGAATILVFLALNIITSGGFWQSMTIASQVYGQYLNSSQHLFKLQTAFINHYWPLLLSIPLLAVLSFRSVLSRQQSIPFTLPVAVAIYLNFLITGGNQGAEYNTLIPLLFGLVLVIKELYIYQYSNSARYLGIILFFILCTLQLIRFGSLVKEPYLSPTSADRQAQEALIKSLATSSGQSVLGDRVDYATILAGKKSPLEASTHNVARDWAKTQPYAAKAEANILERLKNDQIEMAVVTITKFGKGNLLSYIQAHGTLLETIKINYIDAPELPHQIYHLNP